MAATTERKRLTKGLVDRATTTNPKGERLFDTEVAGFGVKVYPTGTKVFVFLYRNAAGVKREYKIGRYGEWTVEAARNEAKVRAVDVDKGVDPLAARAAGKVAAREAFTVKAWVADYLKGAETRKKSWKEDKRYLELLTDRCGAKTLAAVDAADVSAVVTRLANAEKPIAANRALASIRACLQRAWKEGRITENPAKRIDPDRRAEKAGERHRVLSDDELKRLAEAVAERPDPFVRAAFLVLAETGLRVSEALRIAWFDVDLDAAILQLPTTKAGERQSIPLSPAVVELLKALPKRGPWVFPGRKSENHRTSLRKEWEAVRAKAKFPDVHLHDLRRTFGLDIAKRAGLHIAQLLLRHSDIRVTQRVYAPFGLDDLRGALTEGGRLIPLVRKSEEAAK